MTPILKGVAGRTCNSLARYVSIRTRGIYVSRELYEKLGFPSYVETYKDGVDVVCIPRDVNGTNHLRHINIVGSQRSYFYCLTMSDYCRLGKFIFTLKPDKTLTIKNCIKSLDNEKPLRKKTGRPRKNIFKEII
jgi:hypothetical protein